MTDAIKKEVDSELFDTFSERNFISSLFRDMNGKLGFGDTLEIPYQAAFTNTSATSRADASSVTTSVRTLSVDQELFFNAKLPALSTMQKMGGKWVTESARQMSAEAKNIIDSNILDYLAGVSADNAAHQNVAGDAITNTDLQNTVAKLLSDTGRRRENLAWFFHPYGSASVSNISGFIPNFAASESGNVGLPMLGRILGIPVYESTQVPNQRTVSCSAVSVTSNVATVTATDHNLMTGQKVTITGITTELTTSAAITVTDANTFTVALTACNGAMGDGAGTVTVDATENLLVDLTGVYRAIQQQPTTKIVDDYESAAQALQCYAAYGRLAFPECVVSVCSPASSA